MLTLAVPALARAPPELVAGVIVPPVALVVKFQPPVMAPAPVLETVKVRGSATLTRTRGECPRVPVRLRAGGLTSPVPEKEITGAVARLKSFDCVPVNLSLCVVPSAS